MPYVTSLDSVRDRRGETLPHSLEAEESVVGGVLVHGVKFAVVSPFLVAADFYHPALRAIYEAMVELDAAAEPIDSVTVAEQMRALETIDKLRAFGGPERYLTDLKAKVVTVENLGHHAKIVAQKARSRRALNAIERARAEVLDDIDPNLALEKAGKALAHRDPNEFGIDRLLRAGTTITDATIARRTLASPTGIATLDAMLGGGIQPGEQTNLIAPPGFGKTTLATLIAEAAAEAAAPQRRRALYCHAELTAQDLEARILARRAARTDEKYTWRDVLTGKMLEDRRRELLDGSLAIDFLRLRPSATVLDEIRGTARAIADKDGIAPSITIDYIQALALGADRDLRRIIAELSYGLLDIAESLSAPLLVVSSTARGFYGASKESKEIAEANDPRAFLSAGKEAGELEFSAATVMFLSVEAEGKADGWREGRIAIAKSRMGALGFVPIKLHGPSGNILGDEKNQRRFTDGEREIIDAIKDSVGQQIKRTELVELLGGKRNRRYADIKRLEHRGVISEGFDKHLHIESAT